MAASWRDAVDERLGDPSRPCAVAVSKDVEGLALLMAASSRPAPLILLADDATQWTEGMAMFEGLAVVIPPSRSDLAAEATRRGLMPVVMPAHAAGAPSRVDLLQTPGFVVHTSGSTGAPKPVFRPTAHIIRGALARASAVGLGAGAGLVGSTPFWSGQGIVHVVTATCLGGALGVASGIDHRDVLSVLAQPQFACWRATAHMADVLGRCELSHTPRVPRVCLISSPVSARVHRAFEARFGIPLRGSYSSTETGVVAVDAAPDGEVRYGTVGRPLPEVDLVIGDTPWEPAEPGVAGRVWVRSPWQMEGYGVPPVLSRPGDIDGWWPTRDIGLVDGGRVLTLVGRLDDCIRTREGRLVNLEHVAAMLRDIQGIRSALVLPVDGVAGKSFGALLECEAHDLPEIRERMGRSLPAWALPRVLKPVRAQPRLANGKPDRLTALATLLGHAEGR